MIQYRIGLGILVLSGLLFAQPGAAMIKIDLPPVGEYALALLGEKTEIPPLREDETIRTVGESLLDLEQRFFQNSLSDDRGALSPVPENGLVIRLYQKLIQSWTE